MLQHENSLKKIPHWMSPPCAPPCLALCRPTAGTQHLLPSDSFAQQAATGVAHPWARWTRSVGGRRGSSPSEQQGTGSSARATGEWQPALSPVAPHARPSATDEAASPLWLASSSAFPFVTQPIEKEQEGEGRLMGVELWKPQWTFGGRIRWVSVSRPCF
jgi:hypothetical protein